MCGRVGYQRRWQRERLVLPPAGRWVGRNSAPAVTSLWAEERPWSSRRSASASTSAVSGWAHAGVTSAVQILYLPLVGISFEIQHEYIMYWNTHTWLWGKIRKLSVEKCNCTKAFGVIFRCRWYNKISNSLGKLQLFILFPTFDVIQTVLMFLQLHFILGDMSKVVSGEILLDKFLYILLFSAKYVV